MPDFFLCPQGEVNGSTGQRVNKFASWRVNKLVSDRSDKSDSSDATKRISPLAPKICAICGIYKSQYQLDIITQTERTVPLVCCLARRLPRRVYRQSSAGTCRCESVAHFLAGFVLRGNVVSGPRHHRTSERHRLEVGALSLTSPKDSRHRGFACRGVFFTRTDGAVEKRGAA